MPRKFIAILHTYIYLPIYQPPLHHSLRFHPRKKKRKKINPCQTVLRSVESLPAEVKDAGAVHSQMELPDDLATYIHTSIIHGRSIYVGTVPTQGQSRIVSNWPRSFCGMPGPCHSLNPEYRQRGRSSRMQPTNYLTVDLSLQLSWVMALSAGGNPPYYVARIARFQGWIVGWQ